MESQTAWTHPLMDLLRSCKRAGKIRGKHLIPKALIETVKQGPSLLSQQSQPTTSVRFTKLDAWYHIRKVTADEFLRAVRDDQSFMLDGESEKLRSAAMKRQIYVVVIRGNDRKLLPHDATNVAEVVTTYIVENLDLVKLQLQEQLFDKVDNPVAIRDAMRSKTLQDMLQSYWETSDSGRARANLLPAAITGNHRETVELLLEDYTEESLKQSPWLVLAAPLCGSGLSQQSPFHQAAFEGRADCLRLLVAWAQAHKHDIAGLKSVGEFDATGTPTKELTALQVAEEEANFECYNVLSGMFAGAEQKVNAVDRNTHEVRQEEASKRCIRIAAEEDQDDDEQGDQEIPLGEDMTWAELCDSIEQASSERHGDFKGCCALIIQNAVLTDDASAEVARRAMEASAGFRRLIFRGCQCATEWSGLELFRAVGACLRESDASTPGPPLPLARGVHLGITARENLETDEDITSFDARVVEATKEYLSVLCKVPRFLSLGGFPSEEYRNRVFTDPRFVLEASCALACFFAPLVHSFVSKTPEQNERSLDSWHRRVGLLALPRALHRHLWNIGLLLEKQYDDPKMALHPAAAPFLDLTLGCWFGAFLGVSAEADVGSDPWSLWAAYLATDKQEEQDVKVELKEALNLVLETLLDIKEVLDRSIERVRLADFAPRSTEDLLRKHVPEQLLHTMEVAKRLAAVSGEARTSRAGLQPAAAGSLTGRLGAGVLRPQGKAAK